MTWWVTPALAPVFGSLDRVFELDGPRVAVGSMGDVIYVEHEGEGYYVKRYVRAGGHANDWIGSPRVQREWRNLARFAAWGLNVPEVVARGYARRHGRFRRGALITRAIAHSADLATLARQGDARLRERRWRATVSDQVADALATLHRHGFCHGDMKWRNLLVTEGPVPRLFLIDCPAGQHWFGPFLRYRRVKDLACLDKVARHQLSRAARLRFYSRYRNIATLGVAEKRELRKVLAFFQGRD